MAYHFLAIISHYDKGVRVGWNYSSEDKLDKKILNEFMTKIKKKCGEVQLGIHKLSTDSVKISSVVDKDQFFADVIFTDDMDVFIEYVASDQKLNALDVAKFILTVWPSSHLKLQKLLYYTYAEFLERTGVKLFSEPIVSYKYGPVVESVFYQYTEHGSSIIDYEEDGKFIFSADDIAVTPSFIKMVTSEHGSVAIDCVLDVLKKQGKLRPFTLVDKTHRPGGPWHKVYKEGKNNVITDDVILQHHHIVK